jgi:hypothetical protein
MKLRLTALVACLPLSCIAGSCYQNSTTAFGMSANIGVSNSDWNVLTVKDQQTITQNSGVSSISICSKDAFSSINGV